MGGTESVFISVSRSEHLCHQWLKFHKRDRPQNTQNGFADTEHTESGRDALVASEFCKYLW